VDHATAAPFLVQTQQQPTPSTVMNGCRLMIFLGSDQLERLASGGRLVDDDRHRRHERRDGPMEPRVSGGTALVESRRHVYFLPAARFVE
jgi:hypothetical protein